MTKQSLEFESNKERYFFFCIIGILIILVGILIYPNVKGHISGKAVEDGIIGKETTLSLQKSKTPKEYYDMFRCSCCGESIGENCCGMAKERKEYVDQLLLEGVEGDELVYRMVKKFGFDVLMDQSKEQEVKDYIKSKAPDNPPKIELDKQKYDFGTISQSDGVVTTMFTIKNTGGSDLIIDNMDTSCMCTSASLIYNGVEGPTFSMSMHGDNPKDYSLAIPPGESALLKVYYDPMAHGKQDTPEIRVTREITIISNDPVDFQKNVRIELTQVP